MLIDVLHQKDEHGGGTFPVFMQESLQPTITDNKSRIKSSQAVFHEEKMVFLSHFLMQVRRGMREGSRNMEYIAINTEILKKNRV